MSLHEMKTEAAFDAMLKMLPHVTAILEDADMTTEKEKIKSKETTGAQAFGSVIPLVLGKHGSDMIAIVAAVSGMEEKDVRELPLQEMRAIFDDAWKDVVDFFPLCLRMVMNA